MDKMLDFAKWAMKHKKQPVTWLLLGMAFIIIVIEVLGKASINSPSNTANIGSPTRTAIIQQGNNDNVYLPSSQSSTPPPPPQSVPYETLTLPNGEKISQPVYPVNPNLHCGTGTLPALVKVDGTGTVVRIYGSNIECATLLNVASGYQTNFQGAANNVNDPQ